MEMETEKKEYVVPQMTVVEMTMQSSALLAGSGDADCGDSEWGCDGE